MVKETESDLEKVLTAREDRFKKQNKFLQEYNAPLITFTMNIPGPVKTTDWIQKSFERGMQDLQAFCTGNITFIEKDVNSAGPEAFFTVSPGISAEELKRKTVTFENQHAIGRWFDIDVRDKNGRYVSREQLAMSSRKCFLCGKDAKNCARNRTHSANELFEYTKQVLLSYLKEHK